jgi:hypothetical protein
MGVLPIKDRTYNWDMMVDRVQKGVLIPGYWGLWTKPYQGNRFRATCIYTVIFNGIVLFLMAQLDYGIHIYPGDLIQWEFRHQYAIWEWYLRKILVYIYIQCVYIYISNISLEMDGMWWGYWWDIPINMGSYGVDWYSTNKAIQSPNMSGIVMVGYPANMDKLWFTKDNNSIYI